MPVVIGHIYIPVIYIVLYGVFNIIYVVAGGVNAQGKYDHIALNHCFTYHNRPYIYPIMDWKSTQQAPGGLGTAIVVVVALLFVGVPFAFFFHYGLAKLRDFLIKPKSVRSLELIEMQGVHVDGNATYADGRPDAPRGISPTSMDQAPPETGANTSSEGSGTIHAVTTKNQSAKSSAQHSRSPSE